MYKNRFYEQATNYKYPFVYFFQRNLGEFIDLCDFEFFTKVKIIEQNETFLPFDSDFLKTVH